MNDGVHYDVPAAEYFAVPALSASLLVEMGVSPRQFEWRMRVPDRSFTRATEFGTLAHAVLLEPERLSRDIIEAPVNERTGKPYGTDSQAYQTVRDANPGKLILTRDDHDALAAVLDAVRADPLVRRALFQADRKSEVSVVATDPAVAVFDGRVKCRPDLWSPSLGALVDLKTARPMPLGMMPKYAWNLGYFHKAAWYRRVWRLATGDSPAWFWVFVDNEAPFDVSIHDPDPAYLEAAGAEIDLWLARISRCVETGRWPGRTGGELHTLPGPMWALEVIGRMQEQESALVG